MSSCNQVSNKSNGMIAIRIPTKGEIRLIRKTRDLFNKDELFQLGTIRNAVEQHLIKTNDCQMCITCDHWDLNGEPIHTYGYCRSGGVTKDILMAYNDTCDKNCWCPIATK